MHRTRYDAHHICTQRDMTHSCAYVTFESCLCTWVSHVSLCPYMMCVMSHNETWLTHVPMWCDLRHVSFLSHESCLYVPYAHLFLTLHLLMSRYVLMWHDLSHVSLCHICTRIPPHSNIVHTYTHTHKYLYTYIFIYVHICIFIYAQESHHTQTSSTYTHTHINIYIYIYSCMYVYIYILLHTGVIHPLQSRHHLHQK